MKKLHVCIKSLTPSQVEAIIAKMEDPLLSIEDLPLYRRFIDENIFIWTVSLSGLHSLLH